MMNTSLAEPVRGAVAKFVFLELLILSFVIRPVQVSNWTVQNWKVKFSWLSNPYRSFFFSYKNVLIFVGCWLFQMYRCGSLSFILANEESLCLELLFRQKIKYKEVSLGSGKIIIFFFFFHFLDFFLNLSGMHYSVHLHRRSTEIMDSPQKVYWCFQ